MKTRQQISTNNTASTSRARVHSFMAVAGVMIAIICAMILLQDVNAPKQTDANEFSVVSFSPLKVTNPIAEVKSVSLFHW